jgi:hypothetical protein
MLGLIIITLIIAIKKILLTMKLVMTTKTAEKAKILILINLFNSRISLNKISLI